ncbi:hypothetical protein BYT27DRAFT_7122221 [Phlegmacium glaucopus]|jgi:hypothetical protein|nr:hypothetical protein BYT27DRAFT_7122221 [Phlegmacium glaucopus]
MPHSDTPSNGAESSRRLQADPLPSKRGEIGYIAAVEPPTESSLDTTSTSHVLPARHPADRDHSPASPTSPDAVIPPAQFEVVPCHGSEQSSSTDSITKPHGILDFFKPERSPEFGGLRLTSLLIFAAQLTLLGGTVIGWVFTSEHFAHLPTGQNLFAGQPAIIFFHIVFLLAVLVQLVFLERRLFRLRGERYSYLHPGEVLPRHRNNNIPETSTTLAFAPWNRPPLPTYAAALAQSGVGTGDVEDHLIAVSPPPAYGNTRGSTLLLSGLLRNSLRAQNRHSNSSPAVQEFHTDRPLSYVSRDEQWNDAERARQLEETLNRLEPPSAAHIAGS